MYTTYNAHSVLKNCGLNMSLALLVPFARMVGFDACSLLLAMRSFHQQVVLVTEANWRPFERRSLPQNQRGWGKTGWSDTASLRLLSRARELFLPASTKNGTHEDTPPARSYCYTEEQGHFSKSIRRRGLT